MSKLHELVDKRIIEIFETIEKINNIPDYLSEDEFKDFMNILNVLDNLGFINITFNNDGFIVEAII